LEWQQSFTGNAIFKFMTNADITKYRLHNQHITHHVHVSPEEVVAYMGAMQAQDYPGAKWSIALRIPGCTEADVDKAIAQRKIVRTWPMRGTLHFIAAADIRWMLDLMASRVVSGNAGRRRQLELDDKTMKKSARLIEKALQGDKQLTRSDIYDLLDKNGISPQAQRGIHILGYLAHTGLICFAAHNEKQPSFALLDEWVPNAPTMQPDEAMATVALRYFNSHGPATVRDFTWWTGLKLTDARRAVQMVEEQLEKITIGDNTYYMPIGLPEVKAASGVHLLPGFDEYLLGYTDRSAALVKAHAPKVVPGNNGMFMPTIVINGKVSGLWKRTIKKKEAIVESIPFEKLSAAKHKAIAAEVKKYGKYLGMAVRYTER
jgi:hypothetical protein